ncbi:MAG: D-aminoacyl-tRNA deacylase [Atribacterota bacterium]|nr:D-aminoacyl-tRNA deacylase [Atribacterota bacterium]
MKVVIQRVKRASVKIDEKKISSIDQGLVILLGVKNDDTEKEVELLAQKIINLRIFSDEEGKMNLSLAEKGYPLLVVSQFTLYGNCKKGRRPSFIEAAPPEKADYLYQYFIEYLKNNNISVQAGRFQAFMEVEIINNGPVTIILDSNEL